MDLKVITVCLILISHLPVMSQIDQSINRTDAEGRKQGHWIKKNPDGKIIYDGYFVNDIPTGEFRRFYEDNTLKSLLVFSKNGKEAYATLYYPNGFKASTGKYMNQLKEGRWRFFSSTNQGVLIGEGEYSGDKKNGPSIKYYPDSTIAEKVNYLNDVKHGECLKYYPDGIINLRTNYHNGRLDGKFEAFFENGKPEMIGQYKNDLREGIWIIFRKNGSQRFKTTYNSGIPDNNDIDKYQSAYLDSLERNKDKIEDPEKNR